MKRRLTKQEQTLWRRAVRDVSPLPSSPLPETRQFAPPKPAAAIKNRATLFKGAAPSTVRGESKSDAFATGDPRTDRHVRRGRMSIDAVFDLHGHTQSSARAALYGFLLEARARRYRCVLIITGKGAQSSYNPGRGILRKRFREWLSEDDFRKHVIRASPAHPRHGGDGAFYVFLKKRP